MFDSRKNEIQLKAAKLLEEKQMGGIFPVPAEVVAKSLGYRVVRFIPSITSQKIYGAVDREKKTIYINSSDYFRRQLFSLAHELGHVILHKGSKVDYRSDKYEKPDEVEADYFAACLLMPEERFKRSWEYFRGNHRLVSDYFGASPTAAWRRAVDLGLTS